MRLFSNVLTDDHFLDHPRGLGDDRLLVRLRDFNSALAEGVGGNVGGITIDCATFDMHRFIAQPDRLFDRRFDNTAADTDPTALDPALADRKAFLGDGDALSAIRADPGPANTTSGGASSGGSVHIAQAGRGDCDSRSITGAFLGGGGFVIVGGRGIIACPAALTIKGAPLSSIDRVVPFDDVQRPLGLAVIDLAYEEHAAAPDGLAIDLSFVLGNAQAGQGRCPRTRSAEIAVQAAETAGSGGAIGAIAGNPELVAIAGGA